MKRKHTQIQKDLKYSIMEGTANSVKVGFGEHYLNLFAIKALGATNLQVGLLKSLPQLTGSFSQLFSSAITEVLKNRKKLITAGAFLQALMWIPILSVLLIPHEGVWFLILFVTLYQVFGSIIVPAWSSWMGDIVPDRIKGKYFGRRNKIVGFSSFTSMVLAGLLLQLFSKFNQFYGFILIFSIAMLGRLISWYYLSKMSESEYIVPKESKFSFIEFVRKVGKTNYGKFVIYLTLMSFSVQIASPYFAVYMLNDLKFDYLTYMIVTGASAISSFLFISLWGKYTDIFGNKKVLTLTGLLVPFVPILWLVSKNVTYLVLVQIFSGFAWSGFHLSSFNFVFDTVSPPKRVRCVSYYNVLNGIAVFFGAMVGGFLIRFGTMFWSPVYIVFIVSGILRLFTSVVMLPKIKEVKWVKRISEGKLLWYLLTIDVLESLSHPVEVLVSKRVIIRRKGEILLNWLKKIIARALGKTHKYS